MIWYKLLAKEDEVASWAFPSFAQATSVDVEIGQIKAPTAGDLERLQQQTIDEASKKGYEDGYAKGIKTSEGKVAQQVKTLAAVVQSLANPFEEFDERVEQELATLAIQIAKQLVRREIKADAGHVIGVVKEALAALPSSSQNIKLFLHPEDAALVVSALSLEGADESRWSIIEDPVVSRGGCRVATDASTIDATVENRLSSIIAQALGDERARS